MEKPNLVAHA